jgi:hypothetical protein
MLAESTVELGYGAKAAEKAYFGYRKRSLRKHFPGFGDP